MRRCFPRPLKGLRGRGEGQGGDGGGGVCGGGVGGFDRTTKPPSIKVACQNNSLMLDQRIFFPFFFSLTIERTEGEHFASDRIRSSFF